MKKIRVKATFIEDVLGTASSDPDIHENFIASNAPDAKTRKEEVAAVGVEEVVEKSKTIFPKDEDGTPIFWDYQIKGFFKDACSALQRYRAVEIDENGKKKKGAPEKCAKHSCNLTSFKKVIDGCIFPYPRKIRIDMKGAEIGKLERPLRAQTAQGERIALANSETVPAGSEIKFIIKCPDNYYDVVIEWLNYGNQKGLGQWRNASFGRYEYELYDEKGKVIGGNRGQGTVAIDF